MNIPTIGKVTPYPYQWEICEAIKEHIREQWREFDKTRHVKAAFVEAYVSAGKTILLGAIANHATQVGAKVLILARQSELVEQNSDECWNMDTPNSIYSASLNTKSTHFNCVVGTEGTVANALDTDFNDWVPHIILVDECHTISWRDVMGESKTQYAQIINHFKRKNPKVAIIGVTGTPYRGIESIQGPFWEEALEPKIDRQFLVENGYIVPTLFGFGHDDVKYDLDEFGPKSELGTEDFSSSELAAMQEKMDLSTTQKIMREVVEIAKDRNIVMVTCASLRHCEEAASVLPRGSFGIITQATPLKERRDILEKAKTGDIKYLLQIGCLTTGLNRPLIDTSVILRRIGSLTLLVQLLGRGMRLLKPEHVEAGIVKHDHLVLDYSGTMNSMQAMFDDPLLEQAELERAKKENEIKHCPVCGTENSEHARRCIGRDGNGDRCEFFWQSKICEDLVTARGTIKGCGAENDSTAKECRKCGKTLIDPNKALSGTHYSDEDWAEVISMDIKPCNNGGILVLINLDRMCDGKPEVAKLFYNPWSSPGSKRIFEQQFVNRFVSSWQWRKKVSAMPNNQALLKMKAMIMTPTHITHRLNDKGRSVVHGIQFRSGRKMMGSKVVE